MVKGLIRFALIWAISWFLTPYVNRFLDRHGTVRIIAIEPISLHLNEPNRLYNDRDFATALVAWQGDHGEAHKFRERWVRDRRGWWYSRCTGLITSET